MSDSMLKHSECGGSVFIDASPLLRFSGPGLAINPKGVSSPVYEISPRQGGSAAYYCEKCGKEGQDSFLKNCEAKCMICSEVKPLAALDTTYSMAVICKDCVGVMSGKQEPRTAKQRKMLSMLDFSDGIQSADLLKTLGKVHF
jgi:hypothetical protein